MAKSPISIWMELNKRAGESFSLFLMRSYYGDEETAEWLMEQDYDPDALEAHSNQISGIMSNYLEAQVDAPEPSEEGEASANGDDLKDARQESGKGI